MWAITKDKLLAFSSNYNEALCQCGFFAHKALPHQEPLCWVPGQETVCGAGGGAPPCRSAPSPSDPEELPHSSSTHRLPPAAQHTVKSHMYPLSPEQTLCASQISVAMKPSLPTWGGSEANTARSSTATRTQGLVGKAALLPGSYCSRVLDTGSQSFYKGKFQHHPLWFNLLENST